MSNLKLIHQTDSSAIETVVTEARGLAALSADFQQAAGHRKEMLKRAVSVKLDSLIGFMMANFHGTPSRTEVDDILVQHHPLTETRVAKLEQHLVPLIVMRELVARHEMPVDRSQLNHWGEFSERYRAVVI